MKANPAVAEAFERFWQAYPKRQPNPKAVALKMFQTLLRLGVDPEAIVGAAGRYADECRQLGTEGPFIPHARKWLRDRRDLDYPPPAEGEAAAAEAPGNPVMRALLGPITEAEWNAWFRPCRFEVRGPELVVTAPSSFVHDRVRQQYIPLLQRVFQRQRVVLEISK